MKLLIASDLHGSATACEKLLNNFEAEGADKLVLLGDILYHGPRNPLPEGYDPKRVTELLNAAGQKIIAVRGNCDGEVDQMVLGFNIMCEYYALYDGKVKLTLSHGHREEPPLFSGEVYITGHTHVTVNSRDRNGVYRLNPGSLSLPKEGTNKGYILYENGVFTFKTLDGEVFDKLVL